MIASRRILLVLIAALPIPLGATEADETPTSGLPKVVIVGDSIRLSYAFVVSKQLAGKAIVISPRENGGDSNNVLKHLDEWVISEKPAIVHFNCGIHDTKRFKSTSKFQVSPERYEANLREIVGRIRSETGATVLFATTTPIHDARAAQVRKDRDYELLDAIVKRYNAIAKKAMQELTVPVNDLHAAVSNPGEAFETEDLIAADGVHLTTAGRELLGKTVATFIARQLAAGEK
jgi:lysophospholipase L1-like esterase